MGTTLTGTTPANTYDSLIKVTDNGPLSGTAKYLSDGLGNDSVLALSNARVGIGTTTPVSALTVVGTTTSGITIQSSSAASNGLKIFNDSTTDTASIVNHYSGPLVFGTANAEKMRIDSSGNVGIGDPSPSWVLDVNNTSSRARFKANTGDSSIELSSIAGRDWLISSKTDGAFSIYDEDASSERMRITSTGNVGIGTSSPSDKLSVSGTGYVTSSIISTDNGGRAYLTSSCRDAGGNEIGGLFGSLADADAVELRSYTNHPLIIKTNNTERMRIDASGNVGIGTDSPSTFGKLGITALNSATKSAIGIGVNQNGSNASPYTNALIEAMTLGGTAESGIYSINTFFDNSRNDIAIRTSATSGAIAERVRFTENGMTFNGDTAAANALDDYEEGTWTPTDASGGGLTYTQATGNYTKIGREVFVRAYIEFPVTADVNTVIIGGLPFTSSSAHSARGGNITYCNKSAVSYIITNTSATTVSAFNSSGVAVTNANLTAAYLYYSANYNV